MDLVVFVEDAMSIWWTIGKAYLLLGLAYGTVNWLWCHFSARLVYNRHLVLGLIGATILWFPIILLGMFATDRMRARISELIARAPAHSAHSTLGEQMDLQERKRRLLADPSYQQWLTQDEWCATYRIMTEDEKRQLLNNHLDS